MEVKYTLTQDDYRSLMRYMVGQMGVAGPKQAAVVVYGAVLWLISAVVFHSADLPVGVWVSLTLAGVCVLLLPLTSRRVMAGWSIRRAITSLGTQNLFGPVTLVLGDETLVEVTESARSEVRWDKVVAVHDTPDHLFVMVTAQLAAIIPRRAFATDEAFAAFRDLVRSKVKRTPESAAAPPT